MKKNTNKLINKNLCGFCKHKDNDDICNHCVIAQIEGSPIGKPSNFQQKTEMVEHPQHYGGEDNPYEAIKVIEAWEANFNIGTALRYLCRCGKKTIGGTAEAMRLEDLKKARWYLDREIQNIEKDNIN